jgi:hypothetical protein
VVVKHVTWSRNKQKQKQQNTRCKGNRFIKGQAVMEAELVPNLVGYYKSVVRTAKASHAYEVARQAGTIANLEQQRVIQEKLTAEAGLRCEQLQKQYSDVQKQVKVHVAQIDALKAELDALRQAQDAAQGQDQQLALQTRAVVDSLKREIKGLKEDVKQRDEEVREMRQDAVDRAAEAKEAHELARERDRGLREQREQVRTRDLELRKVSHALEQTTARVQGLEADIQESREALKLTTELLKEAEARMRQQMQTQQAAGRRSSQVTAALAAVAATQRALAQPVVQAVVEGVLPIPSKVVKQAAPKPKTIKASRAPVENDSAEEQTDAPSDTGTPIVQRPRKRAAAPTTLQEAPTTDYDAVPDAIVAQKQKQIAARRALAADKENYEPRATKPATKTCVKRKAKVVQVEDFVASPPRLSSPDATPIQEGKAAKRRVAGKSMTSAAIAKAAAAGKTKKSDFSMTPFVDKTRKLSVVPLSPPTKTDQRVRLRDEDETAAQGGKLKKKRKLLGAAQRTLMDDTPKKTLPGSKKVFDFGKDLSPLKRPTSSGLILK